MYNYGSTVSLHDVHFSTIARSNCATPNRNNAESSVVRGLVHSASALGELCERLLQLRLCSIASLEVERTGLLDGTIVDTIVLGFLKSLLQLAQLSEESPDRVDRVAIQLHEVGVPALCP